MSQGEWIEIGEQDSVENLAYARGLFWETVWKHSPYRILLGERTIDGTTGADGLIEHWIPPDLDEARLEFGEGALRQRWTLQLRALDPVTTDRGLQARLHNAGYPAVRVTGTIDDATRIGLRAFQQDQGLEVTGAPDDATRARLLELHKT